MKIGEPIDLIFSSNIKDKNKKLCVKFSIKKGKGNLYYNLGSLSGDLNNILKNGKKIPVDTQVGVDFNEIETLYYNPTGDGDHELVFEITKDEGTKFQSDVWFKVRSEGAMTSFMKNIIDEFKNIQKYGYTNIEKAKKLIEDCDDVNNQDEDSMVIH